MMQDLLSEREMKFSAKRTTSRQTKWIINHDEWNKPCRVSNKAVLIYLGPDRTHNDLSQI